MTVKQVTPRSPDTKFTGTRDDRAAARKTVGMKFPRKTGRKASGRRSPGG